MRRFLRVSNFAALLLLGGEVAVTVGTHNALYVAGTAGGGAALVAFRIATRRKPEAARPAKPPSPARRARYPDGAPEGSCPVCGMDDAERFRLGVGVGEYRGQPAHSACVEWIGGDPGVAKPAPRPSIPSYGISMAEFGTLITAAFGVPPPAIGTAPTIPPSAFGYEPFNLAAPPAAGTYCLCGQHFAEYGAEVSAAMRAHHRSGQCPVQEQARRYWAKGGGSP